MTRRGSCWRRPGRTGRRARRSSAAARATSTAARRPANTIYRAGRDDRIRRHAVRDATGSRTSRSRPRGCARRQARHAGGQLGVDRLPGPGRHGASAELRSTSSAGSFDPAAVRGKVVVVGATAARAVQRLPRDVDERDELMPAPEIPAGVDRDRARRLPARRRRGWLGALAIVVLGAARPAGRVAVRRRRRAARGAASRVSCSCVVAQFAFDARHDRRRGAAAGAALRRWVRRLAAAPPARAPARRAARPPHPRRAATSGRAACARCC